jgi:hypothetical protein
MYQKMGCDIHLHIEIKVNGKWEHFAAPSVNRWYELFEKMAGVCGDIENAISVPKGLPQDLSALTQHIYDYEKRDAECASYLTGNEIVELSEWLDKYGKQVNAVINYDLESGILKTYLLGNSFAGFYKYPEESPEWIEDVRFVFWFDN